LITSSAAQYRIDEVQSLKLKEPSGGQSLEGSFRLLKKSIGDFKFDTDATPIGQESLQLIVLTCRLCISGHLAPRDEQTSLEAANCRRAFRAGETLCPSGKPA